MVAGRLFRTFLVLREQAAPATPASGFMVVYAGTDSLFYTKNDAGVVNGLNPAPQYANSAVSTTPVSGASYATYTSAPSLSVTVPASGSILVTAGLIGSNGTAGASVRVDTVFSGANTKAAADTGGVTMFGGGASTGTTSAERTRLHTGLTAGATTITLQSRASSGTPTLTESWIYVQTLP